MSNSTDACSFRLKESFVAVSKAFKDPREKGFRIGNKHVTPVSGIFQVGQEIKNAKSRLQEILLPQPYFNNILEIRNDPSTNSPELFWHNNKMSVDDHLIRSIAEARRQGNNNDKLRFKNDLRLWQQLKGNILNLQDNGDALFYFVPKSTDPEDGISLGQIRMVDGKIIMENQLLPFKRFEEINKFFGNLTSNRQILFNGDPEGKMSDLLFWGAIGNAIDFKNDLPQLISKSVGPQNINLYMRPNVPADQNVPRNIVVAGFGGSDISQLNQKHISVSIPDSPRVAENSQEAILTSAAAITATIVTGEELVNTTIIKTVTPTTATEVSEPASGLQSIDEAFIDCQNNKFLVKTTIPAISETLNYATVSVFANKIPEVQSNLSSPVIVPEGKLPYKIKKEKEVKNERIIIKTERTTAKESPLVPDKKEGRIKKGNPTIEEKPMKATETVVFSYKASEKAPEPCDAELKEETLSGEEQVTTELKPVSSNTPKEGVEERPEITVPEAIIKPVVKNIQTYRHQLIENILMVMLQKHQGEMIQALEPDVKTFLIPVNDRKLSFVLGGTKIKPATEIEKLEKYTGQNLDIPIMQKTKTRQKINISFIAILLLVKLRLQLLLTVSPEIISRYIYTDRLLLFAAHPERFIISASQPNLAPRG